MKQGDFLMPAAHESEGFVDFAGEPKRLVKLTDPCGRPSVSIPLDIVPRRGMSWGAKVLLGMLGHYLGSGSWVNTETLAADMGVTLRTVHRFLVDLAREGVISLGGEEEL
jgi:hypothetical protein